MIVDKTEIMDQCRDSTINVDFSKSAENFTPSRGREIGGTIFAGAAQSQPTGRALPSLILGTWHSAEDHVRAASHINPYAELINTSLTQPIKSALLACATRPNETKIRRAEASTYFERLAFDLDPIRKRWTAQLPEKSPARLINFPLIYLLPNALDYPDKQFTHDLSQGMPIAGPIAATPWLTARKKCAEMSYQEWKQGIPERNKKSTTELRNHNSQN